MLTAQREALARWRASSKTEASIVSVITLAAVGLPALGLMAAFGWFGLAVFLAGIGALMLGLVLYRPEPPAGAESRYQRPAGQMVIATILNLMLAAGLGIGALAAGTFAIVGLRDITHDTLPVPSELAVFTCAVVLAAIQGVVLPLYAWWRWSADRDQQRLADEIVKSIQTSTASENQEQIRQQHVEIERLTDLRRALENELESLEEERARRADNVE